MRWLISSPHLILPPFVALAIWLAFLALGAGNLFIQPDSASYLRPGRIFWETGRFESPPGVVEVMRTPGYAIPASLMFPNETSKPLTLQIVQFLMLVAIAILLATLPASHWFRPGLKARLLLGLLPVLDPLLHIYTFMVMSEVTSSLFIVGSLWAMMAHLAKGCRGDIWLVLCAILLSFSVLIRPSNVLLLPLLTILVIFLHRPFFPWNGRRFALVCMTSLALALPLGGWMARNAYHTGQAIISLKSSENMLHYQGALVLAHEKNTSFEAIQAEFRLEMEMERATGQPIWEVARPWSGEAGAIFREYPITTARVFIMSLPALFVGPGMSTWRELEENGEFPVALPLTVASLLHLIVVYTLLGSGIILAVRCRVFPVVAFMCLGFWLLAVLPGMGATAYSRFRVPAMPLLIVAGVAAVVAAADRNQATAATPLRR